MIPTLTRRPDDAPADPVLRYLAKQRREQRRERWILLGVRIAAVVIGVIVGCLIR
jgi:hypothetical protein